METQAERTLQLRVDAREQTHSLQESLLREIDGANPTEAQRELLTKYRSDLSYYDGEIAEWSDQVDADRKAREKSEQIRRSANAARGIADLDEDGGVVYRTPGDDAHVGHRGPLAAAARRSDLPGDPGSASAR
jgi:hypothetical protein